MKSRTILKNEVDALLDYRRGVEAYHRDDNWRSGILEHFRENLQRMIKIAGDNGVPILVLAPPVNLRDCPPFKSQPTGNLETTRKAECDRLRAEAVTNSDSSPRTAAHLLPTTGRKS